jgi:hypothetical protein
MAAATAAGVRPGRGGGVDRRRRCGGRIDERDQQHKRYRSAQHGHVGETTQPRTTAAKPPRGDRHRHQRATAAPATAAATHHDGGTDDDADHHDAADDHHHYNDDHDYHDHDYHDHDDNNDNDDYHHADDHHDHHDHHHADDDTDDDDLHQRAVRAGADSDSGAAEPVSGSALPLTQTPDGGQRPMMRAIAVMVMNSLSADRAVIFNDRVSKRSWTSIRATVKASHRIQPVTKAETRKLPW